MQLWPGAPLETMCHSKNNIAEQSPYKKQGKSEGFECCDRPIVRKCPIWVKIGDVLSRVTLKFDE